MQLNNVVLSTLAEVKCVTVTELVYRFKQGLNWARSYLIGRLTHYTACPCGAFMARMSKLCSRYFCINLTLLRRTEHKWTNVFR